MVWQQTVKAFNWCLKPGGTFFCGVGTEMIAIERCHPNAIAALRQAILPGVQLQEPRLVAQVGQLLKAITERRRFPGTFLREPKHILEQHYWRAECRYDLHRRSPSDTRGADAGRNCAG